MPDGIPAVGAQIKVPDPNQGINTMSGILGLKQQQQALQTGAYTQQSAQANAQQDQQKNAELQKAQTLALQGAKSGQYTKPDGTFDRQKMADDISQVAPTYGQGVAGQLLSQANEVVQNQQAHQNLTVDQKKEIGDTFASLAADPHVDNSKFIDSVEKLRQAHRDDPNFSRLLTSMTTHYPGTAPASTQQQLLGQWAQASGGPSQVKPTVIDNNSSFQGGAQNQYTGALSGAGPIVKKQLGPTDLPAYRRQVAAASTEGGAGASNDEALYNDITTKGAQAAKLKSLTQDISALAGEVQTGQYSKAFADKWSALKQTFGIKSDVNDPDTKRQILSKMAAQLKAQSEGGASTDAARAGIEASLPDPEHMGPAAVAQAARYVGSLTDIDAARSRLAQQHRQVSGGASTGLRQADAAFMQNADPRVFEYQSIPAGQERQAYLKQHFKSKEEVQAFLDKQKALKGYGAIQ
jgi:hypothetical protein